MVTRDNPYEYTRGEVMRNIQLNYEKMRRVALTQGYDRVFIVEQDMIVPDDALEKLLECRTPVATGLYALRHGDPAPNLFRHGGKGVKTLGSGLKWPEVQKDWGKTITVTGGAMGCLLVDRTALDFIFMIDECRAPDMKFMSHCATRGIETKARLDVVCGHIRPNGEVLWPDKDTGFRIERMN